MLAAAMEDDMIDDAASDDDENDLEDDGDAEEMEDEDEEGFTDLEDESAQNGEKNGKGKKASLYKAPTAEEMEELRRQEEERGGHFGFAMKVSSLRRVRGLR
jgi:hypothetical protein